jgi:ribonuclease P protein subunit POP4
MISSKNLQIHEFVDLRVNIVRSTDAGFTGINGKIIDETKNTLVVQKDDGRYIVVQKKDNVFEFILKGNERVQVDGSNIMYRPQDRIKKLGIKGNLTRSKI